MLKIELRGFNQEPFSVEELSYDQVVENLHRFNDSNYTSAFVFDNEENLVMTARRKFESKEWAIILIAR